LRALRATRATIGRELSAFLVRGTGRQACPLVPPTWAGAGMPPPGRGGVPLPLWCAVPLCLALARLAGDSAGVTGVAVLSPALSPAPSRRSGLWVHPVCGRCGRRGRQLAGNSQRAWFAARPRVSRLSDDGRPPFFQ
jgi:hypothetical protein